MIPYFPVSPFVVVGSSLGGFRGRKQSGKYYYMDLLSNQDCSISKLANCSSLFLARLFLVVCHLYQFRDNSLFDAYFSPLIIIFSYFQFSSQLLKRTLSSDPAPYILLYKHEHLFSPFLSLAIDSFLNPSRHDALFVHASLLCSYSPRYGLTIRAGGPLSSPCTERDNGARIYLVPLAHFGSDFEIPCLNSPPV
jgi:hypothetical protein